MFKKIAEEDRKDFLMNSFVHLPIGLIIGLTAGTIVVKLIGFDIVFGNILIIFIFALLICVIKILFNYRRLIKKRMKLREDKGAGPEI